MKHFVAQDLFEDRARRGIVIDDITIDREAARGGLFCHVQEGEQAMIRLAFDAQVVEPVATGQGARIETDLARRSRPQKVGAALTEQITVMQLVDCVSEIEAAQEGVRRNLRGAQDVASAIRLNFGEGQQLADAPVEVPPYPFVYRAQDSIERCCSSGCHREPWAGPKDPTRVTDRRSISCSGDLSTASWAGSYRTRLVGAVPSFGRRYRLDHGSYRVRKRSECA